VAKASRSDIAGTPLSIIEGASCSSARRTLILGVGAVVEHVRHVITEYCTDQYHVVATMDVQGMRHQQTGGHDGGPLQQVVADQNIECVVMALKEWTGEWILSDLLACKRRGIPIRDGLELYERLTGKVYLDEAPLRTLLATTSVGLMGKVGKRCLDMALALVCLLLTWPLFVVLPLLIRLTSTGPVMFRQTRTGLHGRRFTMLKFRSMVQHAEEAGVAVWASVKDPRITRVGNFMRRFRLDELPQLINIFRGDMGFIGPRPERPEFVEVLEHLNPYYAIRHSVKPGLTGWAQVCFRYGASVQDAMEKLAYDLYYLKRRSPLLDCVIVLKTVRTVLAGAGAR
jgi:exopolysaccharide biosynthesis polyprenyl glycosylphosphotransferase